MMKAFKRAAPKLGKEHFVRYASITGDFNPIHYDLEFARKLKMPAVVAQGPLVLLLALDALAAEGTLGESGRVVARITGPAFPDAELVVEGHEDGTIQINDGERTVLKGTVETR
jgi:acyl dehydratase